jgi:hypothetical protein
MKNKKDRGGYAVTQFFKLLGLEKCRCMPKKVVECVKSKFSAKRRKDKAQLRFRHRQCVVRCVK